MPGSSLLPFREAIITHLKADAAFTATVPAAQIYGMRTPADKVWPFTSYGAPDSRPLKAQCTRGSIVDVTLHVFSKSKFEDECAEILAALAASIEGPDGHGITLALAGGLKARLRYKGDQILQDGAEADAWHGLAHIEATIL